MQKRTKLAARVLPRYTMAEETMNMVTHIVGGSSGIAGLLLCLLRAENPLALVGCSIYGAGMICLYTISSIYHGLRPGMAKKVMQVLDHCTIYYLIVGTYTAVLACALIPAYPTIGWGLLVVEWALAILATVLTAIDLRKYRVFSMICYIGMGWGIIFFIPQIIQVLSYPGFGWLLSGGIAYTLGAILYGIGSKKPWFHSVFHIFVVLGSVLQLICVLFYVY